MAISKKTKLILYFRSALLSILLIIGCFIMYSCQTKPEILSTKNFKIESSPTSSDVKCPVSVNSDPSFEQFYLSQVTSFYQQIITLLLGLIGVILVISFLYLHFTSNIKAEEMAHNALESSSFQIRMQQVVDKKFAELKSSGDFADLFDKVANLEERTEFLEKQTNEKSYELKEKQPGEADGNS